MFKRRIVVEGNFVKGSIQQSGNEYILLGQVRHGERNDLETVLNMIKELQLVAAEMTAQNAEFTHSEDPIGFPAAFLEHKEEINQAIELGHVIIVDGPPIPTGKTTMVRYLRSLGVVAVEPFNTTTISLATSFDPDPDKHEPWLYGPKSSKPKAKPAQLKEDLD